MSAGIEGGEALREVGRRLKAAGDPGKGLRKELLRGIRDATKGPVLAELKSGALARLPSRGGLGAVAAKNLKVAARTRLSGNEVGVNVLVSVKGMDLPKLEAGKLRHPVYGRAPWVNQKIPAGIFGDAVEGVADSTAKAILAVVDETTRRI